MGAVRVNREDDDAQHVSEDRSDHVKYKKERRTVYTVEKVMQLLQIKKSVLKFKIH